MNDYHEPPQEMSAKGREYVRALVSLKEEIEAVDWYQQRIEVSNDEQLKKILAHNRDEEMEHAAMSLEWLRRNMPGWDDVLKTYLFTEEDIVEIEEGDDSNGGDDSGDLGIGGLKQ